MITVEEMVLPDQVTDLPVQGLKQFDGERTDRLNDLTQQQAREKQQELREVEANNEVKDEEKHDDVRIAQDIQNMQKTKADEKRKQAQDQAQAIGNPNLLEDEAEGEFRMEVEQDNPEVRQRRLWAPKPKAKAKQVVQQSYDASELRPQLSRTQREKDEDMATKAGMPKERRKNFNYIQADYDIFCRSDDEDEDVELQRKKYSEGVWVEDNCEDSKRPTLQETIEKKNTLSLNICTNFLSLATGETSNKQNIERPLEWFSSLRGFPSNDAARVLILMRRFL